MRSKIGYILLLVIAVVYQSCDTTLNIEEPEDFIKYIGGNGDQTGVDLVTDASGNIFLLGNTTSTADGQQLYVVMTSPKGIVLWEKIIGDDGEEEAKDIDISLDGTLVVLANHTDASSGERDFVIYNLDPDDGSTIAKATSGLPGRRDYGSTITPIDDGYIVASYADKGAYKVGLVLAYNSQLQVDTLDWHTTLEQKDPSPGGLGYDVIPIRTIKYNDQYYYTFCYSNTILDEVDGIPDYNYVIYVTTRNGITRFLRVQQSADDPNANERLTSVQAIPGGQGYILSGYISSGVTGRQNMRIARVVPDLYAAVPSQKDVWIREQRTITDGLSPISDVRGSLFASPSSGFLILGIEDLDGNADLFLTKVDNDLLDVWSSPGSSAKLGGINNDLPGAVMETGNGRILICGTMGLGDLGGQTKMVLMNLSPNGLFGE